MRLSARKKLSISCGFEIYIKDKGKAKGSEVTNKRRKIRNNGPKEVREEEREPMEWNVDFGLLGEEGRRV